MGFISPDEGARGLSVAGYYPSPQYPSGTLFPLEERGHSDRRVAKKRSEDWTGGHGEGGAVDEASGTEVRLDAFLIWAGVWHRAPALLYPIHPSA